jgi:hypothetical protein
MREKSCWRIPTKVGKGSLLLFGARVMHWLRRMKRERPGALLARWTRAVENQSTSITEEVTSELGGIIEKNEGRAMCAAEEQARPLFI